MTTPDPTEVYATLRERGRAHVLVTGNEDTALIVAVRRLAVAEGHDVETHLTRLPSDVALRHRVLDTARPRIFTLT